MNVYPFIEAEKSQRRNVKRACELLKVSRAAYYAAREGQSCDRDRQDAELAVLIKAEHKRSKGRYGAPRIHAELQADGHRVGKKRVARLMRQERLVARRRKRRVRTTDSTHAQPIAPNHLDRQFDVNGVALNRVWVSDITYVPTQQGWLYLATVLDLASRRVVGWAMRAQLDAELALTALRAAIVTRRPAPGLLTRSRI